MIFLLGYNHYTPFIKKYKKHEYTRYEAEQTQRKIERTIRKYKKRVAVFESAGLANPEAKARLGEWQAVARDFVKQTGLRRDYAREYVGVERTLFNQGQAQPKGTAPKEKVADNKGMQTDKSKEVAEKSFPSEKWSAISASSSTSVFIAATRQKDGKKDPAVYESDKMMALTLAEKSGMNVFMPPERRAGKNPDCLFDGKPLEMKHVRGDINKLGKNAIKALEQADNVFLFTDNAFSKEMCLTKIKGSIKAKRGTARQKGIIFQEPPKESILYIFTNNQLFKCTWGDVL